MLNITYRYTLPDTNKILSRIIIKVTVSNGRHKGVYNALWDTGADHTYISRKIIKELNLFRTGGRISPITANGKTTCEAYMCSIKLPNQYFIPDLEVFDLGLEDSDFDLVIGMNIITLGDFTISNFEGRTVFTFRMPSVEKTDYTRTPKFGRSSSAGIWDFIKSLFITPAP